MKIIGIEHVGIAVEDLNSSSSFWGDILRIVHTHTESVETESVNTKIYDTGKGKIELLDSLDETSPVQKFIQKTWACFFFWKDWLLSSKQTIFCYYKI